MKIEDYELTVQKRVISDKLINASQKTTRLLIESECLSRCPQQIIAGSCQEQR